MNNFDFSIYDPEDTTVVKVEKKSKVEPEKKTQAFDFSAYDYDDSESSTPEVDPAVESAKKDELYQKYYKAPEYTPEKLKNMSIQEKLEARDALNLEREYLGAKGTSKGILSGLTLGATENIEALKPQPHELGGGFGELVGAAAPIGIAAKAVGYPIKALVKGAGPVTQALAKLEQAFGTGALYGAGKQGVNAVTGNEVDLLDIPRKGAEFATIDSLIRGGGALVKQFLKLSPKHQSQILEQKIIPSDLPKSQYETAEEMLGMVKKIESQAEFPGYSGKLTSSKPIKPERISSSGEDLGLRPVTLKANPSLKEEVGNIFSTNKFYNTTQGGKAFKQEIMNIDEDVYRGVNELYKNSRELHSAIEEIHPQLVSKLESRNAELKAIPEPSDVQKRLIRAQDKILNKLVQYEKVLDDAGNVVGKEITGYKPINNQTMIDQVQSLRQIIDYDFSHGDVKNIYKPLINDLQDSAIRAAETSGNAEAAQALNDARAAYRTWAEAFDNDYVRPFRDASNQDYSKLFKSALDFDESNMLNKILKISERGTELSKGATREIVEKHLGKYFENPRSYSTDEFNKTLRELEAVISPEEANKVKQAFIEANKRPDIRATQRAKRQPTNDELIASRYEKSKPEDIQRLMDSRSGIKQLRQDFSDTKAKKEVFERLTQQKMRSILREGNIEKDFTGDELYKFLNKEKNYELFSEILGESETEALRTSAKVIGKNQVKSEVRKKNLSQAAKKVAMYKTLEVILGLL